MTCNLALAAALIFASDPTSENASVATSNTAIYAPAAIASESVFADLVSQSQALKAIVDGWMSSSVITDEAFLQTSDYLSFKTHAEDLAKADMNGHLLLKTRGTDGDLTCILRGISEDMPKRIANLEAAQAGPDRHQALEELAYLLNDNAEVILAPPAPQ